MKKFFKLQFLLLGFFLVVGTSMQAQNREFTHVKKISMNGVQAMKQNDVVVGYYAYFYVEKKDRKNFTFQLDIMDVNLKTTHKIKFTKPRRSILLETQFNGTHFCFTYLDIKKKSLTSNIYDMNAKLTGTNVIEGLDRTSIQLLYQQQQLEEGYYSGTLIPIPNKGFAVAYTKKDSGLKVKIDMFNNKGKKKWTADSGVSKKAFEIFSPLYYSEDYLVGSIMTRPGRMSQKITETVHIFDNKTGKLLGKVKTENAKAFFAVNGVDFDKDKGEFFMYGTKYGRKNKKPDFKHQLGLFVTYFSPKGTVSDKHFAFWGKDIMKKVKGKDKAKIKKGASVMLHNITRTNTGKFVAVGELFNKEASALGIASKVLSKGQSNTSVAKVVLYNMLVFEFDEHFKTEKVSVIEKPKQNVQLPAGYGWVNEGKLGYILKALGLFDFDFYTANSDRSSFSTVYTSYNRGKKGRNGNRYTIGVISLDEDGHVVSTKMSLKSKPTAFTVLPAKPGYVGVFEYFRKNKTAKIRIEKLDL